MKKYTVHSLIAALMCVSASWAQAEGVTFLAPLSGGEEVPPNDSQARGIALFSLDEAGETMHYTLIVANLHNPVAAHIHGAPAGMNGGVLVPLFNGDTGSGRTSGILAEGSFEVTAELLMEMALGGTYVNVHTNDGVEPGGTGPGDLPPGELRGQIRALKP